ncbi:MAG: hypothetical protein JNJ88_09140 [Planctomycetes bacterium]|nr:hypothetical protein [Planctomycetota bacterium]
MTPEASSHRSRRRQRTSTILVTILGSLALGLLVAFSVRGRMVRGEEGLLRAQPTEVAALQPANLGTSSAGARSPGDIRTKTQILVRDRVSAIPLTGVSLTARGGAANLGGSPTDSAGLWCGPPNALAGVEMMDCILPPELGGITVPIAVPKVAEPDGTLILDVPALARLRVELSATPDVRGIVELHVFDLPPVPPSAPLSDRVREHLEIQRNSTPELYVKQLAERGLRERPMERTKSLEFSSSEDCRLTQIDFDVPYAGDMVAAADSRGCVPLRKRVALQRGEITTVPLLCRRKPIISGIVRDAFGKRLPGIQVTAASKGSFDGTEVLPHSLNEPGGPALIHVVGLGKSVGVAVVQLSRRTNEEGQYEIEMPFTGDVAAWCSLEGSGSAYAERIVPSRDSAVPDLDLRLPPRMEPPLRLLLVAPDGYPLARSTVLVSETDPANPFYRSYPEVCTDESGWLDATILEPGRTYQFSALQGAPLGGVWNASSGLVVELRSGPP